MFLLDAARKAWNFRRIRRRWILRGICTPPHFRRILRRERDRTDRSGEPFSLITFAARDAETAEDTFIRLMKIFRRRLRWIDEIGWLDANRLAVALPGTGFSRAMDVADNVCLSFPEDELLPVCEIYCYPSDEMPGKSARRLAGYAFIRWLPCWSNPRRSESGFWILRWRWRVCSSCGPFSF